MPNLIPKKAIRFLILVFLVSSVDVRAQIIIDPNVTPLEAAQELIQGGTSTVSNVTFIGNHGQLGLFDATNTSLDLTSGVILSTGYVNGILDTSLLSSTSFYGPGDTSILTIPQISSSHDAAVLEFDFIPLIDTLEFRFIFGSEEYPEYVNFGFNDAFGFFVSGENPNGGNYVNENFARVPGTLWPISVTSINAVQNSGYYIDNPLNEILSFDGYTTAITMKVPVVCGVDYHFKIVIADCGDDAFDSGILLETSSFTTAYTPSCPAIMGNVYNDLNENCIQESSEINLPNVVLSVNPGGHVVITDASGYWAIPSILPGMYTITVDTITGGWTTACPITQLLDLQYGISPIVSSFGLLKRYAPPELLIYPNPTYDVVIFEFANEQKQRRYLLQDNNGRLIEEGTFNGTEGQIDLSEYAAGIYLVELENYSIPIKLLKQ
ncbi:MAG: hypothetical protein ACI837_002089 [Crocinitomicaceae bacterium]|jgi:hypothetical protein